MATAPPPRKDDQPMDNPQPPLLHNPVLPQDVEALSALRDQLSDYLATVERNTDAVNNWLADNKNKIILFHQRLERSLNEKNETRAINLIAQMGDVAGFVLSLQDFKSKAETAFGKDSVIEARPVFVRSFHTPSCA